MADYGSELQSCLDIDQQQLLRLIESHQSTTVKCEVPFNLIKLLNNQSAFNYLIKNYRKAKKLLQKIMENVCKRMAGSLDRKNKNISCCLRFLPNPRVLNLMSYTDVGNNGQYEYSRKELMNGQLMMLNQAIVIELSSPETYKHSWSLRCPYCFNSIKDSQTFIEAVCNNTMKNKTKSMVYYCEPCRSEVDMVRVDEKCLDCQRITILVRGTDTLKKKEVYIDWNLVGRVNLGDRIDMLCYFQADFSLQILKDGQIVQLTQIFVCQSLEISNNKQNSLIFLRDSHEQVMSLNVPAHKALELGSLLADHQSIIKAISLFRFDYCKGDKLTALKIIIVCSILINWSSSDYWSRPKTPIVDEKQANEINCYANWRSLNIFIITQEVWLIRKIILLPELKYLVWPSIRSKQSMKQFMLSCHGYIVIVCNPAPEDYSYLTELIRGRIVYKQRQVPISCTIWLICDEIRCQTEKNNKQTLEFMDLFDAVLRVNFQKRHNIVDKQCYHNILYCVDRYVERFTVKREGGPGFKQFLDDQEDACNSSEDVTESKFPYVFLRKYYMNCRTNNGINQRDLIMMQKVAEGLRLLRFHTIMTPNSYSRLSCIDVIFAIMFREERFRNVFKGVTVFRGELSRDASRLLLNDSDRYEMKEMVDEETLESRIVERRRGYFFKAWIERLAKQLDLPVQ